MALPAAMAMTLGGDLLSSFGSQLGQRLFGQDLAQASQDARMQGMQDVSSMIPSLMGNLNYNPMGQTGQEAKFGAQTALDSWQNTATGLANYNRQLQDASTARNLADVQGTAALEQASRAQGDLQDATTQALLTSGATPASAAAAAGQIARQGATNTQNLFGQMAGAASQGAAQAAGITGAAQQGLLADKQMEFEKVRPFLNQMQNIGSVMPALTQSASMTQDANIAAPNLFGATSKLLGKTGTSAAGTSMLGDLFDNDQTADAAGLSNLLGLLGGVQGGSGNQMSNLQALFGGA